MSLLFCDRCGANLSFSSQTYTVHIQMMTDCDGVLISGEDSQYEPPSLLNGIETSYAKDLGDDVYQELVFILCEDCKTEFAIDPFNKGMGFSVYKNFERLFH
jgi:hypothetical protein